jgi:hypothetical protein
MKVRVRHITLPHQTGLDDLRFPQVGGFEFAPNRSETAQELPLVVTSTDRNPMWKFSSQTNEVPLWVRFRDFAARERNCRIIDLAAKLEPTNDFQKPLCHGRYLAECGRSIECVMANFIEAPMGSI